MSIHSHQVSEFYDRDLGRSDFLNLIFKATHELETNQRSSEELESLITFLEKTTANIDSLPKSVWQSALDIAYHTREMSPLNKHGKESVCLWLQCKIFLLRCTENDIVPYEVIKIAMHFLCSWRDLLNPEIIRS